MFEHSKNAAIIGLLLISFLLVVSCGKLGNSRNLTSGPYHPTLTASAITSSSFKLSWITTADAVSIKIFLASEPASIPTGEMPGEILLHTFSGTKITDEVSGLAAYNDVFIRLELTTTNETTSECIHVKTLGGPRAVLDNSLREVSAISPKILRLTIAGPSGGADGAGWQSGTWTVTREDGSSIAVSHKYRQSLPVSMPSYPIGWNGQYDDSYILVDHRIFLELAENIGTREILTISGPNNLSFKLFFSDQYLETPVIQVNQVGYNPRATRRFAYVSHWMGDGGGLVLSDFTTADIITEPDNLNLAKTTYYSNLPIVERSVLDTDAGVAVKEISLSGIPQSENIKFRIRIPGVGVSYKTEISEKAAFKAFYVVTRGLFINRWAGDLSSAYTDWSRPTDDQRLVYTGELLEFSEAPEDTYYSEGSAQTNPKTVNHGYHDAGDFDMRPMHTLVPQLLLRAYEINPSLYSDNQLNIPESGNGIPDLLDEALWGVKLWEQLQESDGGVRQGVQSYRHPNGYYFASADNLPFWTFGRSALTSAQAAGLFAQASRLVAPYDSSRASSLRQKAVLAYNYAKNHEATPAFLMYGAGELYKLTGTTSYKTDFDNSWTAMGPYGAFSNFAWFHLSKGQIGDGSQPMSDYFLAYYSSSNPSSTITSLIDNQIDNQFAFDQADAVINSEHAHRNARPSGYDFTWGAGTTVGKYLDTCLAKMQMGVNGTDKQTLIDALSLSADYILGCNPNSFVYITGLGTRHPMEPVHLDSLTFIKSNQGKPMPGIPVYGPANDVGGASYEVRPRNLFYPDFLETTPVALRYMDLRTAIHNNEFSVWEMQAAEAQLFAVLVGQGMMPSDLPGPIDKSD